ncbi:acetylcholine receptor subunit epsilon isoform X2 [Candoia aspera]|uniref:acetylcholine receptor subunit epsilon isoform X2 n=1 Tax=Candoia aspera TaxID=51853 RepID=UPI002FD8124C
MKAVGSLGQNLWLGLLLCWAALGSPEGNKELQLFNRLFANYDKSRWPVRRVGEVLKISLKLTLTNLISLNTKEETLTTNVWITQEWVDYRLNFSSEEYDKALRVPADLVWLPDIVLENNSKTHNAKEIELQYGLDDNTQEPAKQIIIDPKAFTENGEWAIRHLPARQLLAPTTGLEAPGFSEIHYFLVIQRKPLFYIINIIVPCVLISSLVVLVYFLPAQAGGQKCTVSISVLLAQTVFLFLIAQKVPETSLSVPLIGKYLLFVMTVATLIVMNCVVVLNVSLRSPSTHLMSPNLKHLFLKILPHYLGSTIGPAGDEPQDASRPRRHSSFSIMVKAEEYILKKARSEILFEHQGQRHGLQRAPNYDGLDVQMTTVLYKNLSSLAPEIKECVDACNFITKSTKDQNADGAEIENWVLIGQMIDKLCFWIAILLFTTGTLAIFFMGHLNTVPEDPFPGQEDQ